MLRNFLVALFAKLMTQTLLAAEVPRHFLHGRTDWTFQTFAEACFSMQTKVSSVPCNPALLSLDENRIGGFIFVGHNVQSLTDLKKVIDGDADLQTVRRLIKNDRPEEINAQTEINWVRESWSYSLVPVRINYRSDIRDRALTYVSLFGNVESSVRAQKSFRMNENLRLGIQIQAIYRKFVLSEFFLTDVLAEGGTEKFLPVRSQAALGITPGLSWSLEDYFNYKPQVSLTFTEIEAVDHQYEGFPKKPEVQLGGSIRPEVSHGDLEIGAHLRYSSQSEYARQLIRLAAAYTSEKDTWATSFAVNQFDLGYHHDFKVVKTGVVYDLQKVENVRGSAETLQTLYFQLGAEI